MLIILWQFLKSSTKIINPYVSRLFLIVFFFGKLEINTLIEDNTLFAKLLLSVINIDWAFSSCSAWAIKSDATHFGSFLESATTTISEGPAIKSMPTSPKTCFLALAT